MDTTQPKKRLKAFFKHATIRISSTKDHGFPNDSASTHSIDDDGRSQRSSISAKKDSKLRRIGRGIREWRSKRKRLRGDIRPQPSFNLEGKSFSSSEASLPEGSFEEDEDFSDEDEPVDRLEDRAHGTSEGWRREVPDEKLPCEIIHEEVAVRKSAREHATSRANESETRSWKEMTVPQTIITPPPPEPICRSLLLPDEAPRDTNLKPSGIVFRRDRKRAFDFAQTLSNEPALWTDASHMPVGLKGCNPEHHGGVAVAQKLDQRWVVDSAYTNGVTDITQLESLAILMALQRAADEKRSGTLGEGTVYICSDSTVCLQSIEKGLALASAIWNVIQEARALEADLKVSKCVMRLSEQLCPWGVFRFSDYTQSGTQSGTRSGKELATTIGRSILEQYYELRSLGAWVEFHWVPAHSGLPGNEIADRVATLSRWWLAKVAPRPAQGTRLVIPLNVLTFDEPWTRYCPRKGQPQYNEYMARQLLEDTKNLDVIISTKAIIGPASRRNMTITSPVGVRPGPDGLALQPASKSTCRLLQPPSTLPFPEEGIPEEGIPQEGIPEEGIPQEVIPEEGIPKEAIPQESVPKKVILEEAIPREAIPQEAISQEAIPWEGIPLEDGKAKGPILQPPPPPPPPPPFPQPQPKVQKKQRKRPAAFKNLLCVHCWHTGHLIHQCFEKFPEQKVAFPHRYARYVGRPRLEKVIPAAFHNIARLHPQLMRQAIHGQDSRYMVGRVGISPHLTGQCAVWAFRYQAAQPGCEDAAAAAHKYRWDEAQGAAQLD